MHNLLIGSKSGKLVPKIYISIRVKKLLENDAIKLLLKQFELFSRDIIISSVFEKIILFSFESIGASKDIMQSYER